MLSLIAWIYGKVVAFRNYLYDRGVLDTFDLGAHTISIGNITTGGTGKTPLVAYVAKLLAERGEIVCILTRGYKRTNEKQRVLVSDGGQVLADAFTAGDEPYELAEKLQGKAIVIADADRVSAGEWAKRKFGVTAFVLDDGFQHRRVRRDVDIVCIDAASSSGNKLLPAGRLREPYKNLSRADIAVIIRGEKNLSYQSWRDEFMRVAPGGTTFEAERRLMQITPIDDPDPAIPNLGDPWFAFCGLAEPANFIGHIRQEGLNVAGAESFGDHHHYTQTDINDIAAAAGAAGATALITTRKDAVKLDKLIFTIPCYVAGMELEIFEAERFARLI